MASCRSVRDFLDHSEADLSSLTNLPPEIYSHLTSCTSCLTMRRAAWLLRAGSGTGSVTPADKPWAESLVGLAVPALATGVVIALLAVGACVSARAGLLPGAGVDLSLLAREVGGVEVGLVDPGVEP